METLRKSISQVSVCYDVLQWGVMFCCYNSQDQACVTSSEPGFCSIELHDHSWAASPLLSHQEAIKHCFCFPTYRNHWRNILSSLFISHLSYSQLFNSTLQVHSTLRDLELLINCEADFFSHFLKMWSVGRQASNLHNQKIY